MRLMSTDIDERCFFLRSTHKIVGVFIKDGKGNEYGRLEMYIHLGDHRLNVEEYLGRIYSLKRVKPDERVPEGTKVIYGLRDGHGIYEMIYDKQDRLLKIHFLKEEVKKTGFELRQKHVNRFATVGSLKENVEEVFKKYGFANLKEIIKADGSVVCFYGNKYKHVIGIVVKCNKAKKVTEATALPTYLHIDQINFGQY
ncbi:hypothetical protein [Laceyella putida]|uniref:Uncharacterized protein n=1 Tax=Laceyella putida TaxID=110101 RepID=A0ABW2RPA9_9BACL